MKAFQGLFLCAVIAVSGACSKPLSEEDQIRAAVGGLEAAARARDVKALKEFIADSYSDSQGNKKSDVGALAAYYFLQHPQVHVLTRIVSLEIAEAGKAQVQLVAALAGTAFSSAEELAKLSADLYRFDFTLALEDKDWRITGAAWRPASPSDLF